MPTLSQPLDITLGGDLTVNRLGFGAMRLTGEPARLERTTGIALARQAVDLGVTFIDTADSYDFGANEELLAEALYPYPPALVIATKGGHINLGREWIPLGRPEYLRQQAELSLRRLRLDRIDLYQLHRVDPSVPLADQVGALRQLRDEGKVRHVGLSEVTVEQLVEARADHADRERAEPVQPRRPRVRRRPRTLRTATASPSSRGSRSPRSTGAMPRRCFPSPGGFRPPLPRSLWPGCCTAHRSSCRFRVRPRWLTWPRTWPPHNSG